MAPQKGQKKDSRKVCQHTELGQNDPDGESSVKSRIANVHPGTGKDMSSGTKSEANDAKDITFEPSVSSSDSE